METKKWINQIIKNKEDKNHIKTCKIKRCGECFTLKILL